jgi:hypothetical protein
VFVLYISHVGFRIPRRSAALGATGASRWWTLHRREGAAPTKGPGNRKMRCDGYIVGETRPSAGRSASRLGRSDGFSDGDYRGTEAGRCLMRPCVLIQRATRADKAFSRCAVSDRLVRLVKADGVGDVDNSPTRSTKTQGWCWGSPARSRILAPGGCRGSPSGVGRRYYRWRTPASAFPGRRGVATQNVRLLLARLR